MRSRNDGEPHRGWTDHLGRFPCSLCSSAFSVVMVLGFFIMPLLPVLGEVLQTCMVPPEHANHTLIGRSYSAEDFTVKVISVGDVTGSRQIILWLELTNSATGPEDVVWVVLPGFVKVQVDGGEWRPVYYSPRSEVAYSDSCEHHRRLVYQHHSLKVGPGDRTRIWMVFELSKYEFDTMNNIAFECPTPAGKISGGFNISEERVPSYVPYIDMIRPRDGEITPWLGSIKFQVLDLESHPVNWSAELDGEFLFNGSAPASMDPCPIMVERTLEPLAIPYGSHRLVLRATDGQVEDFVFVNFTLKQPKISELVEKWAINTSAQFDIPFGPGYQSCQTVWDIDGDESMEIVFVTGKGHSKRLWCFGSDQKLEWIYPPMDQEGLLGTPASKVSLVDVDADGVYELCLADRGRLHVLDGDGRVVWVWYTPTGQPIKGAPQGLDVDGDGFVEFFVNDNAGRIHRVSHLGELVWTSFQTGANMGQPTIADIDQDTEYEVLWASTDHHVYCVRAEDSFEKWRFDTGARMANNPVVVADVNNDGEYEAVIWTDSPGAVIGLTSHGEELWRWVHPRDVRILMCQALGDVDRDGAMDMAIMTRSGAFCIDIGGVSPYTKWEVNFTQWSEEGILPPGARMVHWSSYQLIADIDSDGGLEILWLAPYPIVTDGATGMPEAYYINDHIATDRQADNGGWWGDIDGDGVSEWICELRGKTHQRTQIYSLTMNGRFPAESPWPEYYHSAYTAEYQVQQDWLTLKSAYSNSLWFPIPQSGTLLLVLLLFLIGLQTWEDIRRC